MQSLEIVDKILSLKAVVRLMSPKATRLLQVREVDAPRQLSTSP
jgi:hypothetical protein